MKKPMGAAELKKHRKRLGLTQAALGELLGVTKNWIHLIEAGKYGKVLDGYRADELRQMQK